MLLIDSRVWLLWLICCLPWSSANAEKFTVIKGKIEGKPPVREVQLMTVENGVPVKYAGTAIAGNGRLLLPARRERILPDVHKRGR